MRIHELLQPLFLYPLACYLMPENYTCEQLATEAENVSREAAIAANKQDKIRDDDVVKTAVGVTLFWPILLFNEGDGRNAAYLAELKGRMNAIRDASARKNCAITFRQ